MLVRVMVCRVGVLEDCLDILSFQHQQHKHYKYKKNNKLFCRQFIVFIFSYNAAVFHRPETVQVIEVMLLN